MENSGGGATFTENDLNMAKRIWALMNMSKYTMDVTQTVQAAEAIQWMNSSLLPGIEQNILEIKRTFKAASEEA